MHWIGGAHSEMRPPKRRRGQRNSTSADIVLAVRQLVLIAKDDLIAGILNRNGLQTGNGHRWTRERVSSMRSNYRIPVFKAAENGIEPWLNLSNAAKILKFARKRCWKYNWVLEFDIKGLLDASSHCTSRFFERSEEVWSNCRYLNSYAFCPSAIDVNSLELATLYTLQDRLPRDTE